MSCHAGDPSAPAAPTSEIAASGTPPVGTVFQSVLDLNQKPGPFVPQLRNGVDANSTDWPVSFFASWKGAGAFVGCTAALVGAEVLLTAAHCVPADHTLSFQFGITTYSSDCDLNTDYLRANPDASADFALCLLRTPFALPAGYRFETIATPTLDSVIGISLVLTGYGCTDNLVNVGIPDGKYRIGVNSIIQTSNSPAPQPPFSAAYYRPSELNNLLTGNAGANICPGDSGGPAFQIVAGPEQGQQYPNRLLIGVNSRVVYADASHLFWGPSLISATGGPSFRAWAIAWANGKNGQKKTVAICGLAGAPAHCRGSGA
jgi:hypothetical protein